MRATIATAAAAAEPISMAYCPATDPSRPDPIFLFVFVFVSFSFRFLPFRSRPAERSYRQEEARARATCGSYSSNISSSSGSTGRRTYMHTHTHTHNDSRTHATCRDSAAASGMLCVELITLCNWVAPQACRQTYIYRPLCLFACLCEPLDL